MLASTGTEARLYGQQSGRKFCLSMCVQRETKRKLLLGSTEKTGRRRLKREVKKEGTKERKEKGKSPQSV